MSPQALLAIAEEFLLQDEEFAPDYAKACEYLEKVIAQTENLKKRAYTQTSIDDPIDRKRKEDLESRARAALQLGILYYFKLGGLSNNKKMDHYLSSAALAACQLEGLKEIIRISQMLRQPQPYDIHQINRRGESPLHYAAKKGFMRLLDLLFRLGASAILEKEVGGCTALYLACCNGHLPVIDYVLAKGADIDTRGPRGSTLLHAAVSRRQNNVLTYFFERGVTVSGYCNDAGLTSFYCAAKTGNTQAAAILLQYDAYIDETDMQGWTALHWAALEGAIDTVKFLVRNGAAVNALTRHGDTPLHLAASVNQEIVATYLMRQGADRKIKNNAGETPADCTSSMQALLREGELPEELSLSI